MFNFFTNFGWTPISLAPVAQAAHTTNASDDSWIVVNQDGSQVDQELLSTDARGNLHENLLLSLPSFSIPSEATSGRNSTVTTTDARDSASTQMPPASPRFLQSDFPPLERASLPARPGAPARALLEASMGVSPPSGIPEKARQHPPAKFNQSAVWNQTKALSRNKQRCR